MAITTDGDMSPFRFPDPNFQKQVTNPDTGDIWIFEDGVWMLADPNDPDGPINSPTYGSESNSPGTHDELEQMISTLRAEIVTLRNDIIVLKTELQTASINNFLILE